MVVQLTSFWENGVVQLISVWVIGVVLFFALWAILLKVVKRISEKKSPKEEPVQEESVEK